MSFFENYGNLTKEEKLTMLLRGCGHFLFLQSNHGATQDSIIHILKAEGPQSQKSITEKLGIKPASASELITKLENKGLAERKRDPNDKRKVVLSLTEKGGLVPEMKSQEKNHYYDALSEEDKVVLLPLLEKLMKSWIKEGGR